MTKRLLFATSNPYKLEEARSILKNSFIIDGLDALNFDGEIPETQDTIRGNAIQKIEFISDYTSAAVFAEDTGLIVPDLGGAPGVHSARYAGEHKSDQDNISKLLIELSKHSENRGAYFKTVLAYRVVTGQIFTFTGEIHGRIAEAPRGHKGFGYDPVFIPDGYEMTFGELGSAVKNEMSHRRKAMEKFVEFLQKKGIG